MEEKIADAKSQGKEAFAKGDYLAAIYFYELVNALFSGTRFPVPKFRVYLLRTWDNAKCCSIGN